MDEREIESDLAFAVEAAGWAGRRVKALRASGRWSGDMLADVGDQAADALLQGLIRGRYPRDGVLSEETSDSKERLGRERTWIVDPLDGTREFSEGREDFAVHVALTLGGRCALAAVALPSLGRVLWGVTLAGFERAGIAENDGALALDPARAGLSRGDAPQTGAPRVAVSRSHTPAWSGRFAERIGARETIPAGSVGYKAMLLLLGRADVYVHQRGLKEWDTCAPETVARALGWTVCKLRGEGHRYNQADPRNHELVICRPALRQQVLSALQESGALA
jgi:3'(2'), 5'-bisphosphate nucleotidase